MGTKNKQISTGRINPSERTGLSDKLSRNELFDVLSQERRRCALYYLHQHSGTVELRDLVDYVTAWQYDQPLSELDADDRMCVYSALHQVHLPKLDEAGLIEYDTDKSEIRIEDELEYAQLYLEYDPESDISWSSFYVGLVGIGVVLSLLTQFTVYPFDWLTSSVLVWILLTMFGLGAIGHVVYEWRNKITVSQLFEVNT